MGSAAVGKGDVPGSDARAVVVADRIPGVNAGDPGGKHFDAPRKRKSQQQGQHNSGTGYEIPK
ncbi:MAG: hypothetical protein Q8N47_07605 [Bryobacterales bacterium]|nr:hypothetical protein [Bryobacterales bacterium]